MKIQKISILPNYNLLAENQYKNNKIKNKAQTINYTSVPYYNDIAFQARVDKHLPRFFEANKERMPKTVKKFIEGLKDKASMTPLQAQAEAFIALAGATTIAAIQTAFPKDEEDLFTTLQEPSASKATRGILGVYRQDKELLEMENRDILADKENLTVWLVKKIFLEGKTLDEINTDFEKEADPEFLSLYRAKEKDGQPIRPSTLKALGIQTPSSEYMQSLRFTREGYSDMVGERISQGLSDFMASLSEDQRTERARGTVLRFIKHWESIPLDKKLDMLLEQDREIELLELYKNSRAEKKVGKPASERKEANETEQTIPTKKDTFTIKKDKIDTGLTYDDELFGMWARNNFIKFELTLDDEAKKLLQIKREQRRAEKWAAMSPEEQTEYISKLKAGAEPLRYALIDAWNNNPDILISLSKFLKKRNIERPEEFVFRSVEYNKYQSEIMTEFWAINPEYAQRWGEAIKDSHFKVKSAMNDDTYEDLKASIMKAKTERSKEVKDKVTTYKQILSNEDYMKYPEYIRDFIDIYTEKNHELVKYLPIEYLKDFFDVGTTEVEKGAILAWCKELNGEELTIEDLGYIETIKQADSKKVNKMNRALEAATAEILYEITGNPFIFRTPAADCKKILSRIARAEQRISYIEREGNVIEVRIKQTEIDNKKLEELYKKYKSPVSKEYMDKVVRTYFLDFGIDTDERELFAAAYLELSDYLSNYGRGIEILFNEPNKYPPEVREQYFMNILTNAPEELKPLIKNGELRTAEEFMREDRVHKIIETIRHKYYFIPDNGFEPFKNAYSPVLRAGKPAMLDEVYDTITKNSLIKELLGGFSTLFSFTRKHVNTGDRLALLCAEQAMADVLYKATNEPQVYALTYQELAEAIEKFASVKKVNNQEQIIHSKLLNSSFSIHLKRKLNFYQMDRTIAQYKENILEYMQTIDNKSSIIDGEEILYCLNTDETKSFLDDYVARRINFTLED